MGWIGYAVVAFGLVTWVLSLPLTLVHELGHALPALAVSRDRVIVRVGWRPERFVSYGRLDLHLRLVNRPRWGWFGYFEVDWKVLKRWQAVAVTAGGPLVSIVILAGLWIGAALVRWPASILVWAPALAVTWQVLLTAVPMRYPGWFGPYAGMTSDGYRIIGLLRSSEE